MTYSRYSNMELIDLPDCGSLTENGRCDCLDVPACLGKGCPAFHPKSAPDGVFARLRSLSEEKQAHIAKKYYGGRRPWAQPIGDGNV